MPINIFYKILNIFLILLFFSCSNKEIERKKITIGKIFKASFSTTNSYNNNVVYQWWIGNHPDNSDYSLEPIGEKALFTPDIKGNYDLYVSIRDTNDLELELIELYYVAVAEQIKAKPQKIISDEALNQLATTNDNDTIVNIDSTSISSVSDTVSSTTKNKSHTSQVKHKVNANKFSGWTIQLSSRASLELAKKDQLKAVDNGYDAYIEQTFISKTKKTWYRVRIGHFKSKKTAQKIQNEIKSFWDKDTWIDRVRNK